MKTVDWTLECTVLYSGLNRYELNVIKFIDYS